MRTTSNQMLGADVCASNPLTSRHEKYMPQQYAQNQCLCLNHVISRR